MWMLSGYGDHLEEGMPGLKASAAEAGAPDGFVDVVAQLQPIADGDDTPPHWDVTFATDAVEATAALASERGSEAPRGPGHAPWARHAFPRVPPGIWMSFRQGKEGS